MVHYYLVRSVSAERKDSEMVENLFRLFFQDDYNEKHDISTVYKPLP